MTEAYFGMNDFFPFNRAELMTAEPDIYKLMRSIGNRIREAFTASKRSHGDRSPRRNRRS